MRSPAHSRSNRHAMPCTTTQPGRAETATGEQQLPLIKAFPIRRTKLGGPRGYSDDMLMEELQIGGGHSCQKET